MKKYENINIEIVTMCEMDIIRTSDGVWDMEIEDMYGQEFTS